MPTNQTKTPTYYQQIHSAQRNLTICKRVHRTVKAVIGYYLSRTNHRHQLAWPTRTTIAEDLGISLKTVRRAFAAAMEVQALEVVFYSIQEVQRAEVPSPSPARSEDQLRQATIGLGRIHRAGHSGRSSETHPAARPEPSGNQGRLH